MFFLIYFVFSGDYCIETIDGKCKNICKNSPKKFENIFSYIPTDNEISTSNNEINNLYIANDVPYFDSIHNFIFCDSSVHLIYEKSISSIKIKDHIYVNSDEILRDAPILFKINSSLIVEIDTEKKIDSTQIILESTREIILSTRFYVEEFPENLIFISPQSKRIRINDKTENVLKVYNDTSKFILNRNMKYYCITDKPNKCSNYNYPSMKYAYSMSEIVDLAAYVFIDTSEPQIFSYVYGYYHIFVSKGSSITYSSSHYFSDSEFYVILHSKTIEMNNLLFEGDGNVTLMTRSNISVLSTTKKCDINLALKTHMPFELENSFIHPIKDDFSINMEKKIHIHDYSLYRGPKNLKELFEPDKFLRIEDEYRFDNLTIDLLKEYDYSQMLYIFKPGTVEIPVTWKKSCRFHGHEPNETTFIYSDVHIFEDYSIDNFISCNDRNEQMNNIIVKPSRRFYFDAFSNENYTIMIDKDIYFYGDYPYRFVNEPDKYYESHQCRIVGNGNIMFNDSQLLSAVRTLCEVDSTVRLVFSAQQIPKIYACVGQSSLEECKSEIPDIDSLEDYEWIWLRNLKTKKKFQNKICDIERTYLTDKHEFMDDYYMYEFDNDLFLTAKADITFEFNYNKGIINVYENQIDNLKALKSTAKITYFLLFNEINLYYDEDPTEIDFNIVLYDKNYFLNMKCSNNYIPNSISLEGECNIYVKGYILLRANLFKKQDTINFLVDDNDCYQILYSDEQLENALLNDFYFCDTYEKFVEYAKIQRVNMTFIYKSIKLQFSSNYQNFGIKNFYFYNGITINIDVPDDATLFINDYIITIAVDEIENTTYYYLHNEDTRNKFVFDVKELININIDKTSSNIPIIELTGPKHTVEVFPNISLANIENCIISVNNNLTIISPYPQYLYNIFGSTPITFSPRWSYLYLSDDGKKLFQSNPIHSYEMPDNDDDLNENIVLAVGKNNIFSFLSKWSRKHNIFIIQEENDLYINQPSKIAFLQSGLLLNDKIRFISGSVTIITKDNFTLFSKNEVLDKFDRTYLYDVKLDISENEKENEYVNVYMYLDSFDSNFKQKIQLINDYYDTSISQITIFFYYKQINDWDCLRMNLINTYIYNYDVRCYYDYICFGDSDSGINEDCPRNSLVINSILELNKTMIEFPGVPILVRSDTEFYFNYDKSINIDIYATKKSIKLSFPQDLLLFELTNENEIKLNYPNIITYTIKNAATIYLKGNDFAIFKINGYSDCDVTLSLNSEVKVRGYLNVNSNLFIAVIKNSYHLFSEDPDSLANIFGDSLEPYIRKCAYDNPNYANSCYDKPGDYFDDILNGPIDFNEIKIVHYYYPKEIELPSVAKNIMVYFDDNCRKPLTFKNISTIHLRSKSAYINKYWLISTNYNRTVFKLYNYTILSFCNEANGYINFQLTNKESYIELRNCSYLQSPPYISIFQYGNEINKLFIYGTLEEYECFMNLLTSYIGIDILFVHTNEHYCICDNEHSCAKCKLNVYGTINTNNKITNDPGMNVNIRVFSDIEVSSNVFTNEHNVFVYENIQLILTDVDIVNQNVNEGIKIDNLIFNNVNKVLLKPKQSELKIVMRNNQPGLDFNVEVDKILKLNVIDSNKQNLKASKIYASGSGDLYAKNYPYDKIINIESVRIYKGVYIICNGCNSQSISNSIYENTVIAIYNHFENDFDTYTKIIVFLFSFEKSIDADINKLNGQIIELKRNSMNSIHLLNDKNKLRFTNITELIFNDNLTIELVSSNGSVLLDNSDSDLFIVGFEKNLTIKQKGNITTNTNKIVIQPMSNNVTIIIDDSVDIEKHKVRIEPDGTKEITITVIGSKNIINKESLKNFFEIDDDLFTVIFPEKKKLKLSIGIIIGICAGAVVLIIAIVLIIVFALKKKRKAKDVTFSETFDEDTSFMV